MKNYYSPSTGGFYNTDFFVGPTMTVPNEAAKEGDLLVLEVPNPACNMPDDVVEITDEDRAVLFAGQLNGKNIAAGKDGKPALVDPPAITKAQIEANMRAVRNRELSATDGAVNRHRDEIDMGVATTITDKAFKDVLVYRQALRDLPETITEASNFEVMLPAKPGALK